MAGRWREAGFHLYLCCGRYGPGVGPLLWTAAMVSPLMHNFLLTVSLSVVVLYYNLSVNSGLRRLLTEQQSWPPMDNERVRDD